jgi:predicted ArsR family transcriptional regulator
LLDLLILHGPLTASGAGRLLGLEPNAVSFHLRQLASYGFVAEAEGGKGRQRPWRLVRPSYRWRDGSTNPELNLAGEVLSEVAIGRRIEQLRSWLVRRPDEPAGWREAAGATFSTLFLTEAELAELHDRLAKLAMTHADRLDPAQRPAGSRPVAVQIYAFPLPDDGVPEAEGRGQQVATD